MTSAVFLFFTSGSPVAIITDVFWQTAKMRQNPENFSRDIADKNFETVMNEKRPRSATIGQKSERIPCDKSLFYNSALSVPAYVCEVVDVLIVWAAITS